MAELIVAGIMVYSILVLGVIALCKAAYSGPAGCQEDADRLEGKENRG